MSSSDPFTTSAGGSSNDEGRCRDLERYDEDSEEDDYDDDELLLGGELTEGDADDDIQNYNRWFVQQQRICQSRDQDEQLEHAKKRRKRIAEAILGGIHLTSHHHPRNHFFDPTSPSSPRPALQREKEVPIYSILRNPEGSIILKVRLEDRSCNHASCSNTTTIGDEHGTVAST